MKNYYEILGVSKDASLDEIKKVYRKLALEYHPDRNPQGTDKFKEIAEAYETLSDDQKRKEYNFKLENPNAGRFGGRNPFGGNPFGGNFEDIFSQMFGGGNNQQRRRTAPEKIVDIQISPVDSFKGADIEISYLRKSDCQTCRGTGGEKTGCMVCSGQGYITQRAGTGMFQQILRTVCNACGGKGQIVINACNSCSGSGTKDNPEKIRVTIPKGIDEGQLLRVGGKGDFYSGMIGDLIIRINMVSKDGFEKNGNDLIYNKFFNLDELNRAEFEVPHPNGVLSIKFPKEFNTSIPLRVRGKGYVTNMTGDLYVKMDVKYTRS
jgi:molecular chaperone DnaJ